MGRLMLINVLSYYQKPRISGQAWLWPTSLSVGWERDAVLAQNVRSGGKNALVSSVVDAHFEWRCEWEGAESHRNEPKENRDTQEMWGKVTSTAWRGLVTWIYKHRGTLTAERHFSRPSGLWVTENRNAGGEFYWWFYILSRNSTFHLSRQQRQEDTSGCEVMLVWVQPLLGSRCRERCSCWACSRSCMPPGMWNRGSKADQKARGCGWTLRCGLICPARCPRPRQTGPCHRGRTREAPAKSLYSAALQDVVKILFSETIQKSLLPFGNSQMEVFPHVAFFLSLPEVLLRNLGSPGGSTALSV